MQLAALAAAPVACTTERRRLEPLHAAPARPSVEKRSMPVEPHCARVALPPEPPGLPIQDGPTDPPRVPIVRPELLGGFYDGLARLCAGHASDHLRIAVFGDSNLTMDLPTGRLRRRMQRRFGDGGHGFVALGKPWSHYIHMDVRHHVGAGWTSYAITTKPTSDGYYGLGGIVAESRYPGAITYVETAPKGSIVGSTASRFDFYYIERPSGGAVDLVLDGAPQGRVETKSAQARGALGFHRVEATDGPHRLDVVATSTGIARVSGIALERDTPGVVIDSFGVGSMNTKTLGRHDPTVFGAMLGRRRYDLVVFLTGANDIFTMDAVPETMHRLVALCRGALPDVSLLVVTPPDRGLRRSMKQTQQVVAQRHEVAKNEGCALWDQFEAMGGAGSMGRFVHEKFAVSDAVHFNERGASFVADRLLVALMDGFEKHLVRGGVDGCGGSSDSG